MDHRLTILSQSVCHGILDVDAHIGVAELHKRCFDAILKPWEAWSKDTELKISDTTIHLPTVLAPLLVSTTRPDVDAVYNQALTGTTRRFKQGKPINISLLINQDCYLAALQRREESEFNEIQAVEPSGRSVRIVHPFD